VAADTVSDRVLNRTLLQRQHLLARSRTDPMAMIEHLLGLQAQEPLPPYLSLAARCEGFDPAAVSDALADRSAVRLLLMRGTIHLVTVRDARLLRPFVQKLLDKVARTSVPARPAAEVPADDVRRAVDDLLAELGAVDWRGWALAEEELEPGLRSAAAPVRGPNGRVVAAVNVSTATARVTREELVETFVPGLLRTTAAISLGLGFRERSAALAR